MGLLFSINILGKKSQRNTERASGFPFAAREMKSRMESSAMNSEQSSPPHAVALRGVPGARVALLLQDMNTMSS